MEKNFEHVKGTFEYLLTVPNLVYYFIAFMTILMIMVVLEMNRIERFFRNKSAQIYDVHVNEMDNFPGFKGWYNKWNTRIAYAFFASIFGSAFLAFRGRYFERGLSFSYFGISFVVMLSMFCLLTFVFYLQQNYAPRFVNKFSAFLYLVFLILLLVGLLNFTYYSDFGQSIIYYN